MKLGERDRCTILFYIVLILKYIIYLNNLVFYYDYEIKLIKLQRKKRN